MTVSTVDLQAYNTLKLPAYTQYLLCWDNVEKLKQLRRDWLAEFPRIFVLGGGSNLVLTKDVEVPCVLSMARNLRVVESNHDRVVIDVDAGYSWNDFVLYCLAQGWFGLENLVSIPGTVGAAPVQNIGAYGRQISDFCIEVQTFDWLSGEVKNHAAKDCGFTYRNSIFKPKNNQVNNRTIITRLRLALNTEKSIHLEDSFAAELCQLFALDDLSNVDPINLADMISQLRKRKLPDIDVVANVGSFFHNPVISIHDYESSPSLHGIISHNLANGKVKISAAALIESKKWKGYKTPSGAGVSEKHSLCLVNRGGAKGTDIISLAQKIQKDVFASYGVELKIEPAIYK